MPSFEQQRTEPLNGIRNGGRGFGIPPPEKFRSGHLPRSAVPLSRTMPVDDYSELGSDMDISSDTEEEIYCGKYSPESSPPQNGISHGRIPNGSTGISRQHPYYSDGYSDFSSSVEAARQPARQQWKQGSMSGYTEDEDEGSSGLSGLMGRGEFTAVSENGRGRQTEEKYSSTGHFRNYTAVSAAKVNDFNYDINCGDLNFLTFLVFSSMQSSGTSYDSKSTIDLVGIMVTFKDMFLICSEPSVMEDNWCKCIADG